MGKTGKKTEKAIEESEGPSCPVGLRRNGESFGGDSEVTERFAGKALEDGIRQLNLSAIHHYNIGEYQAAVEDLREAIHLDANRAEVWCNLAHAQAALTQDADAEASFRKALELQPDLDQAVSGLGVLMLAGGRTGDSIAFLEKFMASETPSVRTMIAYSRALAGAGRHADAVETLERAASLAPDNPEVTAELQAYTGDKAN
jgi:Flp pilus assembly protein TadD